MDRRALLKTLAALAVVRPAPEQIGRLLTVERCQVCDRERRPGIGPCPRWSGHLFKSDFCVRCGHARDLPNAECLVHGVV